MNGARINIYVSVMRMIDGKKAIFLDAGFTLLEPVAPVQEVYYRAAMDLGADIPEQEFRSRMIDQWPEINRSYRSRHPELDSSEEYERNAWRLFTRAVAAPFESLAGIHEQWLERLFDHFDSPAAWRPIPGVEAALDGLAKQDLVLGVVSNWHSSLLTILKGHGLFDRFRFVLTSAEAGKKKPHRHIFEEAIRRAGTCAGDVVHIGDSWEEDVLGAQAAGLSAIHFRPDPQKGGDDPNVPILSCWSRLGA